MLRPLMSAYAPVPLMSVVQVEVTFELLRESSRPYQSVSAKRRGDVGLVAGGVRKRPPRRSELVADQVTPGGERRSDPRFCLFGRNPDAEMDRATAVRSRLIHRLEPERRPKIVRIDEVPVGAVGARLIAKDRPPERHDL